MNKKVRAVLAGVLLTVSLGSFVGCGNTAKNGTSQEQSKSDIKEINGDEVLKMLKDKKDVVIIDVRSDKEYLEGHIKDAIDVPVDEFENKMTDLKEYKDKPVIVYCNTGKKSKKAAKMLIKNGFKDVYDGEGVKKYKYDLVKYTDLKGKDLVEFLKKEKDVILVDVRSEKDFAKGHLKDAINIPIKELDKNLDKLDKNKKIVLYCRTGNKSAKGAAELMKKGYTKVYNAVDGVAEYNFDLVQN